MEEDVDETYETNKTQKSDNEGSNNEGSATRSTDTAEALDCKITAASISDD